MRATALSALGLGEAHPMFRNLSTRGFKSRRSEPHLRSVSEWVVRAGTPAKIWKLGPRLALGSAELQVTVGVRAGEPPELLLDPTEVGAEKADSSSPSFLRPKTAAARELASA
jgi:hypothetical protein